MQRVPWWHGRPVRPNSTQNSTAAVVITLVALVELAAAVAAVLLGAPPRLLGFAMLGAVVAVPAAASLRRREKNR